MILGASVKNFIALHHFSQTYWRSPLWEGHYRCATIGRKHRFAAIGWPQGQPVVGISPPVAGALERCLNYRLGEGPDTGRMRFARSTYRGKRPAKRAAMPLPQGASPILIVSPGLKQRINKRRHRRALLKHDQPTQQQHDHHDRGQPELLSDPHEVPQIFEKFEHQKGFSRFDGSRVWTTR
jgi:hypothetical protein